MIDLNPRHLATVERILAEHAPGLEVRAFGSRATWTARDFSDLDLALVGESRLDTDVIWRLKEAFSESDLPIRVDVLDWHAISDKFREAIEPDCVELQARGAAHANGSGDWSKTTVGEFAPFTYGKGLSKKQRNETGGVPVYGSNGIIGYHDTALTTSPTIIIGRKGTVGAVHYSPGPCWPIDTTFYVTDEDPELLRFKYYALQSLGLEEGNGDSAVPGLNRNFAHSLSVSLPAVGEQRRIARVLGGLDDKIELNRRMAETLEEMARVLFRSWFVDFEPVRAKQEGRWRRGQSLPGLPAHLYEAFPERLEPSELGPIPAGWRVAALGDCFELTMGQSPPGSTYNEQGDGLPFFQGRADFGFRYPGNRKFCTAPTRRAQPADTLVSVRAPVGDINMAWEECCIGRGVAALRHKSGSTSFTYYAAQALQPVLRAYESEGTVFGAINKRQFESLRVLEPPTDVVDAFDVEACRLDARLRVGTANSCALAYLRKVLSARLLSDGATKSPLS